MSVSSPHGDNEIHGVEINSDIMKFAHVESHYELGNMSYNKWDSRSSSFRL